MFQTMQEYWICSAWLHRAMPSKFLRVICGHPVLSIFGSKFTPGKPQIFYTGFFVNYSTNHSMSVSNLCILDFQRNAYLLISCRKIEELTVKFRIFFDEIPEYKHTSQKNISCFKKFLQKVLFSFCAFSERQSLALESLEILLTMFVSNILGNVYHELRNFMILWRTDWCGYKF